MRRDRAPAPRAHGGAPSWAVGALGVGLYAALIVGEARRPLRRRTQLRLERSMRNLALAGVGALVSGMLERPLIGPLARTVATRRWGLLPSLRLHPWIELPLAVAALDYSLYGWHVWTHKGPLWRFHQVHHADFDLDASTALCFHFGELAASVPYRAAQVLMIGVRPQALRVWRWWLFASVAFHHANLRLPAAFEERLSAVLVTPRLHGLHHSTDVAKRDSNWSAGLTLWDRLHGTFLPIGSHEQAEIGLPEWRERRAPTLGLLLTLPFTGRRPTSAAVGQGETPQRWRQVNLFGAALG